MILEFFFKITSYLLWFAFPESSVNRLKSGVHVNYEQASSSYLTENTVGVHNRGVKGVIGVYYENKLQQTRGSLYQ